MEENKGEEVVEKVVKPEVDNGQNAAGDNPADETKTAASQEAGAEDDSFEDVLSFFDGGNGAAGGSGSEDANVVTLSRQQHEQLIEKASMFDMISSSPAAMAVVKHFQAGGTVEELFKRYDNTDYSQLPPEVLYRRKMNEDKATFGLTDDEVEEEIQNFLSLSPAQQKRQVAEYRMALEAGRGRGLGELNEALDKAAQRQKQSGEKFMGEFDSILNEWVKKKKFANIDFTQAEAEKVKRVLIENNGLPIFDKDGNLDAHKVFKAIVAPMYLAEILKNTRTKGEQSGMRRVLEEAHAIPSQASSGGSATAAAKKDGETDPVKEAMAKRGWVPPTKK